MKALENIDNVEFISLESALDLCQNREEADIKALEIRIFLANLAQQLISINLD